MKKCCLLIFLCLLFVFALTGCYEPKNDTPYSASDMESEWQGGYDGVEAFQNTPVITPTE